MNTSKVNGRLIFGIFASIAEFERELIRDRVRSGIAAARAKHVRLGRPRVVVNASRIDAPRAQGRFGAKSLLKQESVRRLLSGPFVACPKTYESSSPLFSLRITSFQDNYLASGEFVGNPVRISTGTLDLSSRGRYFEGAKRVIL